MNIFIYGNQNFKNEINKILVNSKIESILEDVKIEDISNIDILKEKIAINPNDIYLIDEDKIIKKSRFKFLKQKDGIEEDFLLQYGVNDLSIDSLDEIPNYIIRKYERTASKEKDKSLEIKNEDLLLDNELANLLESKEEENNKNLTSSILEEPMGININELDSLIEVDTSDEVKTDTNYINMEDFDENFGLNNVSFDYDDDSTFNEDLKSDEDLLQDILNNSIVDEDDYEFVGETFEDKNFLDDIFPNSTIFDMDENSTKSIFAKSKSSKAKSLKFSISLSFSSICSSETTSSFSLIISIFSIFFSFSSSKASSKLKSFNASISSKLLSFSLCKSISLSFSFSCKTIFIGVILFSSISKILLFGKISSKKFTSSKVSPTNS